MISPRATLIRIAFSFIRPSSRAPINPSVAVVSAALMTRTSATRNISSRRSVAAIQSVGSWLAPRRLVNFHPEGAHQPRRRDPDIAEAEDAADAPAQHSVGAVLVEFAALAVGVLNEQALCRSQRQRDDVLRHRFGASALIGCNRQFRWQITGRHPIDASGGELQ